MRRRHAIPQRTLEGEVKVYSSVPAFCTITAPFSVVARIPKFIYIYLFLWGHLPDVSSRNKRGRVPANQKSIPKSPVTSHPGLSANPRVVTAEVDQSKYEAIAMMKFRQEQVCAPSRVLPVSLSSASLPLWTHSALILAGVTTIVMFESSNMSCLSQNII